MCSSAPIRLERFGAVSYTPRRRSPQGGVGGDRTHAPPEIRILRVPEAFFCGPGDRTPRPTPKSASGARRRCFSGGPGVRSPPRGERGGGAQSQNCDRPPGESG
eukprot:11991431-Alexandrium_andersonii.AAC.1